MISSPSAPPDIGSQPSSLLGGLQLEPTLNYAWAGFALFVGLVIYTAARPKEPYNGVPAIGRTGFITSYIDAIRFLKRSNDTIKEGYEKYKQGMFRVPELNRWHLVVAGPKYIEELRKAPDDVLSLDEASNDMLAADYTVGPDVLADMYHIGVIRTQLTRNLAAVFPEMRDELVCAFGDNIPITEDWSRVKALDAVMNIVSRASNRIFVGLPTCRDPEYATLNIRFTIDVIIAAQVINLFPTFLKPIIGRLFTNVERAIQTGLKHVGPIIEERKRKIDEFGPDYPDKPRDLLSWLMDQARGEQRTARNLTLRILAMNFAAIHTSSMSFTQALYYLASHPEYIQPLREEIEAVIAEEGWNKVAMTRMRKLDSFMKESQRLQGLGLVTMSRRAMKDFTFSNGVRVPKGEFVSVATARHSDEGIYPDAEAFNGFRFSDMREEEGEGAKNQMVATSFDYLPFGHGKHACPGRFFAANELKAMMAHAVLTYDIKMENEGVRPESRWHAFSCVPHPKAEVLFRKRRV